MPDTCLHPREVTTRVGISISAESMSIIVYVDVAADTGVVVIFRVGASIFADIAIAVTVSHDVKLLAVVIIAMAHGIAAEVAVVTALEFTLPAPLEDSSISC